MLFMDSTEISCLSQHLHNVHRGENDPPKHSMKLPLAPVLWRLSRLITGSVNASVPVEAILPLPSAPSSDNDGVFAQSEDVTDGRLNSFPLAQTVVAVKWELIDHRSNIKHVTLSRTGAQSRVAGWRLSSAGCLLASRIRNGRKVTV